MVSMLASSAVDRGFEPRSDQDYKIGICCFSANYAALRRKSKENQDNVFEWGDMSMCRLHCFSELAL